MANTQGRTTVPRHIEWIDSTETYANSGSPVHSDLGAKMVQNNRALARHCIRSVGTSFPELGSNPDQAQPEITYVPGNILGPWPFSPTPGIGRTYCEWYVRCSLADDETAVVLPVQNGIQLMNPTETAITGTGVMANYGPFQSKYDVDTIIKQGRGSFGLIIKPSVDEDSYEIGDIIYNGMSNRNSFITDATGAGKFTTWIGLGNECHHVVQLIRGSVPVTPWLKIIGFNTTTVTNDTLTFAPAITNSVVAELPKGTVQWRSALVFPVTLSSVLFRERPRPDYSFAGGY